MRRGRKLDDMTYPKLRSPLVDWVDYKAAPRRHKPAIVAAAGARALAGSHTIWYVSAPGVLTQCSVTCDATTLGQSRTPIVRVISDLNSFEKPGLKMFPAH